MKILIDAFPDGVKKIDEDGWLPLHTTVANDTSVEINHENIDRCVSGWCEKDR